MGYKYKQLIIAYAAYVFGWFATTYGGVLVVSIAGGNVEFEHQSIFHGELGLLLGLALIPFSALFLNIPVYVWLTLRISHYGGRLAIGSLYKHTFLAGLAAPVLFYVLAWLVVRSTWHFVLCLLAIQLFVAEISFRRIKC